MAVECENCRSWISADELAVEYPLEQGKQRKGWLCERCALMIYDRPVERELHETFVESW